MTKAVLMYFQDNTKNIFLILLVMIVFSGLGFYSAYVLQEDRAEIILGEKDSTINRLNSEITYLRNVFGDLLIGYEDMEKEVRMYEEGFTQKTAENMDLSERYAQLDDKYTSLLQDYSDLNSSYMLEREALLNKTRVGENKFRISFNILSFECHQDAIVSVKAPVDTNLTEILKCNLFDEKTFIAVSWSRSPAEPDLNATLKEACASVENYLNATGLNNTMVKGDYKIRFINFTAVVDGGPRYVLVSTWYDYSLLHHYLCVIKQEDDTVVATFHELMDSLSTN